MAAFFGFWYAFSQILHKAKPLKMHHLQGKSSEMDSLN